MRELVFSFLIFDLIKTEVRKVGLFERYIEGAAQAKPSSSAVMMNRRRRRRRRRCGAGAATRSKEPPPWRSTR